jgi:hypothetical protein
MHTARARIPLVVAPAGANLAFTPVNETQNLVV